jgi:uncharacterized protein with GYD domain
VATFVILGNWTEQGVKSFSDAPARAKANQAAVAAMGGRVVGTYWTLGSYDFVSIVEAPDDATVTAGLLVLGAAGNARTLTLRAFDSAELEKIIATAKAAGG